jgi:hypothetical protein
MKYLFLLFAVVCFSCQQNNSTPTTTPADTVAKTIALPAEDSITQALRIALVAIETQELQQTSPIKSMDIENIGHEMISLKTFYTIKKEELANEMKLSTNKEKTIHALAYLDKMIGGASTKPDVYKVQFHLNALLANTTLYNEQHTKYLKQDLSDIRLQFPD